METLGKTTIGASTLSMGTGYEWAYGPYEATRDGVIRNVAMYSSSGTDVPIKMGVYLDNNNYPGELVAQTGVVIQPAGWKTGTANGIIEVGKSYWLGSMHTTGGNSGRYDSGSKKVRRVAGNYANGLSAQYPGDSTIITNGDASIYLSYDIIPTFPFIPEKSSYVYNVNRDVVEVELDGGLSRRRRDIVGSASRIDCTFFLLPYEYQYFMAFYRNYLKRGAIPFKLELLLEQPYLEKVTASIVANTLQMKQIGLNYEVQVQLETVPENNDNFDELVLFFYTGKEESETGILHMLEVLTNEDLAV